MHGAGLSATEYQVRKQAFRNILLSTDCRQWYCLLLALFAVNMMSQTMANSGCIAWPHCRCGAGSLHVYMKSISWVPLFLIAASDCADEWGSPLISLNCRAGPWFINGFLGVRNESCWQHDFLASQNGIQHVEGILWDFFLIVNHVPNAAN